ncbi:MAG: hypothetical protein IJO43_02170 [Bacilli bacterium]|nr:hypothetical protein [Bacilli bacterium]
MSNTFSDEYIKLKQTRTLMNQDIIKNKKRMIWEYFRSFNDVNITNLEQNISKNTFLFKAPLFLIHGSNMMSCGNEDIDEIYVDEGFAANKKNIRVIKHQSTHETLHSLCRKQGIRFGRPITKDNEYLKGINEAATQVFADDTENDELGPEDDYLYFIKNIMRIMKNAVGPSLLANQYLNNDISFEQKFNEITDGKFDDFAFIINNIYILSKNRHYKTISTDEEEMLIAHEKIILDFTSSFIRKVAITDPTIYQRIKEDFFNQEFLTRLNIDELNNGFGTK